MAAIASATVRSQSDHIFSVLWEQINEDDTGAQVEISPKFKNKTAVFGGTFNGGTLSLECSEDGVIFAAVGSRTAVGQVSVTNAARYWRIGNNAAGLSEDIDVFLICTP